MNTLSEIAVGKVQAGLGTEPKTLDELVSVTGLKQSTVKTALSHLQEMGLATKGPGRKTGGRGRPALTFVAHHPVVTITQ